MYLPFNIIIIRPVLCENHFNTVKNLETVLIFKTQITVLIEPDTQLKEQLLHPASLCCNFWQQDLFCVWDGPKMPYCS
jgi:hypothetical protein